MVKGVKSAFDLTVERRYSVSMSRPLRIQYPGRLVLRYEQRTTQGSHIHLQKRIQLSHPQNRQEPANG